MLYFWRNEKQIIMKKGSYYFGLLTEEEKKQFKKNVRNEKYFNFLMEREFFSSLFDFLERSFVWSKTPKSQGHDYWQNIANSNRENIEG